MGSLLAVILAWGLRLVTVGIPIHGAARGGGILAPRNPHEPEGAMTFISHVECTICGHRHDAKTASGRNP